MMANLGARLGSLPSDPAEVTRLGREYVRLQKKMDDKLGEWEALQM